MEGGGGALSLIIISLLEDQVLSNYIDVTDSLFDSLMGHLAMSDGHISVVLIWAFYTVLQPII